MKKILILVLLASVAAATVQFYDVPASVDPGSSFSFVVHVENSSGSVSGDNVTVSVSPAGITCAPNGTTDSNGNTTVYCDVDPNAGNTSYTLNANSSALGESNTTTVTVNSLTISVGPNVSSALPGEGITFNVNVTNSTGGRVQGVTVTPSFPCPGTTADTNSSGQVSFSCVIPEGTLAGTWTFNATSNNGQGSTAYEILEKWQDPGVSNTVPSALEKGLNNTNVMNITVTNKINAPHNYTAIISCNDSNLVPSASPGVLLISDYNGTGTFSVSINVTADAASGEYTCSYNVSCVENSSYYSYSDFTVTVNPYHNFTLWSDNNTKQVTPGENVSFTLSVNNTGEQDNTYSAACSVNDSSYSCSLDASSLTIANGSSKNLTVTVQSPKDSDKSLRGVTVNVTDSQGLLKQYSFTVQPGNAYYPELTSNVTGNKSYASPGQTARATVYVTNTGNTDTQYNITLTYNGLSGWNLSGYSDGNSFNSSTSFLLDVASGANKTINLNVSIPESAGYGKAANVVIQAVSENNSAHNDTITVYFKTPSYNYDVRVVYNSTHLNATLWNVTLEGSVQTGNWSWTLYYPNGTTVLSGSENFAGSKVLFISNDTSSWPVGVYTINATFSSDKGEQPYTGKFVLAKSLYLVLGGDLSGSTSYCLGSRKNATVTSYVNEISSISVTPSVTSSPAGISCSVLSSKSPYTVQCYFGAAGSNFNITATSSYSNCAQANLTCTVSPALTATSNKLTGIGVVSCQQQQQDQQNQQNQGQQGQQSGSQNNTSQQQNNNTSSQGNLNISLGLALKVSGKDEVTLLIQNVGNASGNVSVSVAEEGEWEHFNLSYDKQVEVQAKKAVNYNFNYSVLPGAPPGKYNITILVLGVKRTVQITVPEPDNNKTVNRYYEYSKDGNKTKIVLYVRNLENQNKTLNITETIPKTIAKNISEVSILTNESYEVVNPDPVIVWTVTLAPSESKKIEYVVNKRVENMSVFSDPLVQGTGKETEAQPEEPAVQATGYDFTGVLIMLAITIMFVWIIFSYLYMEPFYKPVIDQALEKVGIRKTGKRFKKKQFRKKRRIEIPRFKKKAKQVVEKSEEVKEEVVSEYKVKPESKPESKGSVDDLLDWIKK